MTMPTKEASSSLAFFVILWYDILSMFWKNKNFKALGKFFLLIFALCFILLNFPYVVYYSERASMSLNYRVILAKLAMPDFAKQEKLAWIWEVKAQEISGNIFIDKIGVKAPLVFADNQVKMTDSQLRELLDRGALFYDGSVLPGKIGKTIILGHSAPAGWPEIKHDNVFSDISKLKNSEKIIIEINNKEYVYAVFDQFIVDRGGDLPEYTDLTKSENVLLLVSCWPPGKRAKRIVLAAQFIKL